MTLDNAWIVLLLAIAIALYTRGVAKLWQRAGKGAGVSIAQTICFATGCIVLIVALLSPLDELAASSFAAHMIQHELLMLLAAPLFVLGRPLAAWTWSLPSSARHRVRNVIRHRALRISWSTLSSPMGAFVAHALALWLWHIPACFDAALGNEALHVLQHTCFLGTALFFWWTVLQRPANGARDGIAVLSLFATMMHTGALGFLLTLAPTPWYAVQASAVSQLGLTALEDQQIGGLIMWVPAGAVYLVAALYVMARWIAEPVATPFNEPASSRPSPPPGGMLQLGRAPRASVRTP